MIRSPSGPVMCNFNPPSPCGEGRMVPLYNLERLKFQSTLPVRGGTRSAWLWRTSQRYFNPPSPCGEGRDCQIQPSILIKNFNPPSPCGEGRDAQIIDDGKYFISIHPPRAGRDRMPFCRAPQNSVFQSTLPVRGGTPCADAVQRESVFQSTLPVRGGTLAAELPILRRGAFQSTLPVRGGTAKVHKITLYTHAYMKEFSSHLLTIVMYGFNVISVSFQTDTYFSANIAVIL